MTFIALHKGSSEKLGQSDLQSGHLLYLCAAHVRQPWSGRRFKHEMGLSPSSLCSEWRGLMLDMFLLDNY